MPQKHLNGRVSANAAGKALGGGSAINVCEFVIEMCCGEKWKKNLTKRQAAGSEETKLTTMPRGN